MPYYVMCRISGGATATREAVLTRHGVPVVFGTRGEADATAEDLRQDRQPASAAADSHYWVVECAAGGDAVGEAHASFPSHTSGREDGNTMTPHTPDIR